MCHLTGCTLKSTSALDAELEQLSEFDRYHYKEFDSTSDSDVERLIALYDRTVAPTIRSHSVTKLPNSELLSLFNAAVISFDYSEASDTLADMTRLATILEQRGAAKGRIWRHLYVAHVRSGDADAANLVRQRLGEHAESQALIELPPIDRSTKTVIRLDDDGRALVSPVNLASGRRIVVIVHPGCGYAQRAVQFLENNPEFSRLFEDDVLWTVHPSAVAEMDVIRAWNEQHPGAEISPATNTRHWPEISNGWLSPSIYFFENGELRDKIVGFNERFEPDLRAALARFTRGARSASQ